MVPPASHPSIADDFNIALEIRLIREEQHANRVAIEQQSALIAKQNDAITRLTGEVVRVSAEMQGQRDRCDERTAKQNSDIRELKEARGENTQTQLRTLTEQNAELKRAKQAQDEDIRKVKREVFFAALKVLGTLAAGGGLLRILQALSH
ncbi:MAG: hypothetical protein LLG14_11315 [Nocardiaceae bacterium]|nr:hypothetical protein [Nocardiaceae bacterium]